MARSRRALAEAQQHRTAADDDPVRRVAADELSALMDAARPPRREIETRYCRRLQANSRAMKGVVPVSSVASSETLCTVILTHLVFVALPDGRYTTSTVAASILFVTLWYQRRMRDNALSCQCNGSRDDIRGNGPPVFDVSMMPSA